VVQNVEKLAVVVQKLVKVLVGHVRS